MAKVLFSPFCVFIVATIVSTRDEFPTNLAPMIGARYNSIRNGAGLDTDPLVTNTTERPQQSEHVLTHPNQCVCSEIYDPVCASNQKSYYNLCQMECDIGPNTNVTVLHQGNCIPF